MEVSAGLVPSRSTTEESVYVLWPPLQATCMPGPRRFLYLPSQQRDIITSPVTQLTCLPLASLLVVPLCPPGNSRLIFPISGSFT